MLQQLDSSIDLFLKMTDIIFNPLEFWFGYDIEQRENGKYPWEYTCNIGSFVINYLKPDLQHFLDMVDPKDFPLH